MGKSIRIVMNVPGYNQVRNSGEVRALLGDLADDIARRATASAQAFGVAHHVDAPPDGEDVKVTVSAGGSRARAYVTAKSVRARLAEHHDRALMQALGGGG